MLFLSTYTPCVLQTVQVKTTYYDLMPGLKYLPVKALE